MDARELWRAYETLEKATVRGASAERLLTDIVSLVRYALHQDGALVPYADHVPERFRAPGSPSRRATAGRSSDEQRRWLGMMRDHIATSVAIEIDDFDLTPFASDGGLARAAGVRQGPQGHCAGVE